MTVGPLERVSIREPDAESRVREYLAGQGYTLTPRVALRGGDIVAEREGRRLLVEVKADRPGHITSPATIYVDACTLFGQIVLRMGQNLADVYAIAIRPVHTRLISPTVSVLARLSVKVLLVENDGSVRELMADSGAR